MGAMMCFVRVLVSVLVLFCIVCKGQSMCRYVYDPMNSTITGLCQKIVFTPDGARACYWFQTDQNSQDVRVPYVGALQVVPTPGGQVFAALCLFERHIPGFSQDDSFVVSFSPDFSNEYSTERFGDRADTSTATDDSTDVGPGGRKILPDIGQSTTTYNNNTVIISTEEGVEESPKPTGDNDSTLSTKDTALIVLGCVAAVVVPGFIILVALRLRKKKKQQKKSDQLTEGRRISILALRRSDYPNSVFGISNPSTSSHNTNDVAMTSSQARRSQSNSSGHEKAVRFVEGNRVIPRRMYLPEVHSYIGLRSPEEHLKDDRSESSLSEDVWTTGRAQRDGVFHTNSEPDMLY
ncbi:uncharacterized protein [Littorina saxatilis]|uniref:Uncharacterized protein n=1 Tax=Littorina saxatilis TaxID=31220 RepID=A0AAN9BGV0_9CAEN